jgi:molybdopterin molybdotransferase
VLPALAQASGLLPAPPRLASLASSVTFRPPVSYFLPVKLSTGPNAELLAIPDPSNTSGDFAGLIETDGFVELPAEPTEFPRGTLAPFRAWV